MPGASVSILTISIWEQATAPCERGKDTSPLRIMSPGSAEREKEPPMARDAYAGKVALLVRLLPFIAEAEAFALKGGTAINLFYRDMPRLSADLT